MRFSFLNRFKLGVSVVDKEAAVFGGIFVEEDVISDLDSIKCVCAS